MLAPSRTRFGTLTGAPWRAALAVVWVVWTCQPLRAADLPGTESEHLGQVGLLRVGIGFCDEPRAFEIQVPESRKEAVKDRLVRLGGPLFRYLDQIDGSEGETPYEPQAPPEVQTIDIALLVAWTPIGLVAGATWGALVGGSEEKIRRDLVVVNDVLGRLGQPGGVQKALLVLLEGQVPAVNVLTNRLEDGSKLRQPSLMDTLAPFPPAYQAALGPSCNPATCGDCDIVVNLKVINWELTGLDQANPPLSLSLLVRGTICNLREGTRGRIFYAKYEGQKIKFNQWSKDGGQALQRELFQGLQQVADQIATHVPRPSSGPVLASHPKP
jgi:hypothetical protein